MWRGSGIPSTGRHAAWTHSGHPASGLCRNDPFRDPRHRATCRLDSLRTRSGLPATGMCRNYPCRASSHRAVPQGPVQGFRPQGDIYLMDPFRASLHRDLPLWTIMASGQHIPVVGSPERVLAAYRPVGEPRTGPWDIPPCAGLPASMLCHLDQCRASS